LIQGRARATPCLLVTGTESGQAECLSQTCPEGRAGTGRAILQRLGNPDRGHLWMTMLPPARAVAGAAVSVLPRLLS